MKKLLLVFLVLFIPSVAFGAPAFVQSDGFSAVTSVVHAFGSNNTAGCLLTNAIYIEDAAATVTVMTDTRLNTWTAVTGYIAIQGGRMIIYEAHNCAAGANTTTTTVSAAVRVNSIISEYSGVKTTGTIIDAIASSGTEADDCVSNSLTTTQAGDLLYSFSLSNGGTNATAGSGYTRTGTYSFNKASQTEDKVGGAAGSETAAWTTSGVNQCISLLVSFFDTSTPTPTPTATPTPVPASGAKRVLLLGAG